MGELEKIQFIINRWGYLNLEQIALLLNKNIKTIQLQKEQLIKLKMLNIDTLPKKNYFTLISKAQSHLGREHKVEHFLKLCKLTKFNCKFAKLHSFLRSLTISVSTLF